MGLSTAQERTGASVRPEVDNKISRDGTLRQWSRRSAVVVKRTFSGVLVGVRMQLVNGLVTSNLPMELEGGECCAQQV